MVTPAVKKRGYRFGVFEVDLETQELRKRGIRIKLGGQAFQILTLLLDHAGHPVTREQLRHAIWPDEAWGDHDQRLNKAMNKIREALADSADTPRFLETLPRVGYRFLVPVEVLPGSPAAPESHSPPPLAVEPLVPVTPAPRRFPRLALPLALAAVGALALALYLRQPPPPPAAMVPVPLTTFPGIEDRPSFSPDGTQCVFAWSGEKGGNFDLYVVTLGIGGARRLIGGPEGETNPAWAPDGKWIAFRRGNGVWLVRPDGSGAARLAEARILGDAGGLAWSPDSTAVLAADAGAAFTHRLAAIRVGTGERTLFPAPPGGLSGDRGPAFSPDGRRVAFIRATAQQWRDIFVAGANPSGRLEGEIRRVTSMQSRIDSVAWTEDGRDLIFSAATPAGGISYLYRVSADGGKIRDLAGVRLEGSNPAISYRSKTLVFSRTTLEPTTIHKVDLTGRAARVEPLLSSTSRDYSPDISPDGELVVMSSGRSGTPQLWTFRKDGTSPRQITFLGNAGASVPRWSPDGNSVAFESRPDGVSRIFVTGAEGGPVRRLTDRDQMETRANFSRDGRFVYFAARANDGEPLNLYRVAAGGGKPERLTKDGGVFAIESLDRKDLVYAHPDGEIRRMPVGGGAPALLAKGALGRSAFAVGRRGIYYVTAAAEDGSSALLLLSPGSQEPRKLARIPHPIHNAIALSPDESYLLYTEMRPPESDLLSFTPFR
ncbi:MAG: winged helix-turn-helix domain-containing protein [Bryobacteraceae bacterium]|nr:winged helix-turn-helix domain-containing protein [Bryobacteraceae bacterium]